MIISMNSSSLCQLNLFEIRRGRKGTMGFLARSRALLLLLLLCISTIPVKEVQANHTYDTKARFTGSSNPLTQSYTCGSGATLLVLGIVTAGNTARTGGAPTYNGVAMTQVDSTRIATEVNVEMWYLADPSTGSAYTISVPNSNTRTLYVTASSYKAASGKTSILDVSNGGQDTTGSANPYVCVTTTADGDAIVDILGDGLDTAPTANDGAYTLLYSTDDGAYSDNAQYRLQPAAGMDCPDWTVASDDWAMVVGAFKEVTAGVVGTTTTTDAILYSSRWYTHRANNYYWVAYHNGTQPVIYSSPDGLTWNSQGNIFSGAPENTLSWGVVFESNTIHAGRGYFSGTAHVGYRQGTLNSNGTVSWGSESASSITSQYSEGGVGHTDSSSLPWVFTANSSHILARNSQANGQGTWTASPYDLPDAVSSDSGMMLFPVPDGTQDMLAIKGFGSVAGAGAIVTQDFNNGSSSWDSLSPKPNSF